MPILNPSIQYSLLKLNNGENSGNTERFYIRYLKIASRNLYRNLFTIKASIKFKDDLKISIPLINSKFCCKMNEIDFQNPTINNFYKYFLDQMNNNINIIATFSQKVPGEYIKLSEDNYDTNFFKPSIFYSNCHSWYFTDTPIAVLSLRLINIESLEPDMIQLINLEIDLMVAAGFTLVLCANYSLLYQYFLFDLIQNNQFSEIHINANTSLEIEAFLRSAKNKPFNTFRGFLYIYSPYIDKDSETKKILREFRKSPRISILTFSNDIFNSLKMPIPYSVKPFVYCKTGFKQEFLRIELNNVPLYDDADDNDTFVPLKTSGFSICYISPCDFLNWKSDRLKILFDDKVNKNRIEKYVNYEDIHIMKKDYYANDPLAIGYIKTKNLLKVNEIEEKIKEIIQKRKGKKFKKDSIFAISTDKRIQKSIKYVTYAYTYIENSFDKNFFIHRPQIYTTFKATKKFFKKTDVNINKLINEKKQIERMLYNNLDPYILKAEEYYKNNKMFQKLFGYVFKKFVQYKDFTTQIMHFICNDLLHKPDNYITNIWLNDPKNFIKNFIKIANEAKDEYYLNRLKDLEENIQTNLKKCKKGIIYQVETGEGKSCIICIIAAILALNGKYVHIASSNIKLANRDYMDSYNFFKQLDLKSAVFCHDNELPVQPKKVTKNKKKKNDKKKKKKNDKKRKEEDKKDTENDHIKKDDNDEIKIEIDIDDDNDDQVNFDDEEYENENDKLDVNITVNDNDINIDINLNDNEEEEEDKIINDDDDDNFDNIENIINNDDQFFKGNFQNYFKTNTQDKKTQYAKFYYNDDFNYYDEKQFKNSSRMNFIACGLKSNNKIPKKKPNIVFSTFVNFECFYLKMMEMSPGYIEEYYENCALIIDEADSILIDEIVNGTITSRDVKSNVKDILEFVYDQKQQNFSAEETLEKVKEKWPKCVDLVLKDVEKMYSEINMLEEPKFKNGKRYSIETFKVKNNKMKRHLFKKAINIDRENYYIKNEEEEEEEEYDDDFDFNFDADIEDLDEFVEGEEEEEENDKPVNFSQIVPFDFDHKGILEPNKEFSGFIQQFIAIKESKTKNIKNMIIKDMSLNYLYVSHPIFIKLYSKICGFTGTIGSLNEKKIYEEQYNLKTMKIPRNEANLRVELPMILCDSITERNNNIVFEILKFHQQGNPVLVIFQDLKEINKVAKLLYIQGIHCINIFNGKNEIIRPDKIAGVQGAITLGTNVCARGTNITPKKKPLHVIITFYSSNKRSMDQARGRTARQGSQGTSRVICLKEQFLNQQIMNDDTMQTIIDEFSIKNEQQLKFIKTFKELKPWIFSSEISKQSLRQEDVTKMRKTRINVNRISAYNFEFPIKMNVQTFLKIQAQKIFSIFNCPNSKYTWTLYQKYVREMILESWSLMINEFDEEFFSRKENEEYKKEVDILDEKNYDSNSLDYHKERTELNQKFSRKIWTYKKELYNRTDQLIEQICEYLPKKLYDIVPSFMFIFDKISKDYECKIIESFGVLSKVFAQFNNFDYLSCQVGFKPFSLLTGSGARITYKNISKTNFITDPEIKYLKMAPRNHFCFLSITEKIDDLFNMIFQQVNQVMGNKIFLKFFMRRTLGGCEFGICLNFDFKNEGIKDPNCIIDQDPLLYLTINIKSLVPVLAGILVIVLVFVAILSKKMIEWFAAFPLKITKEIALKAVGVILNQVAPYLVNFGLDKIIKLLNETLEKQVARLEKIKTDQAEQAANIIIAIKSIFNSTIGDQANGKAVRFCDGKIKFKFNFKKFSRRCYDPRRLVKISFLILLCVATFILNFNTRKDAIRQQKDADKIELSFKSINKEEKVKGKVRKTINDLSEYEEEKLRKEGVLIIENIHDNYNDIEENYYEENDKEQNHNEDLEENDIEENYYDDKDENYFDDDDDDDEVLLTKEERYVRDQKYRKEIQDQTEIISKTYVYKFKSCNPYKKAVKSRYFVEDDKASIEKITNGIANIEKYVRKGMFKKKCLRMRYREMKRIFIQQIRFYETNQFPSILPIIGFVIRGKREDLFVEFKENGTLEKIINKGKIKLTKTQKLIIAYGVASALEHLHSHGVVHLSLNPSNIWLDSKFYPFLCEFSNSAIARTEVACILLKPKIGFMSPGFIAPEFNDNYKINQNSFSLDVYAFGMLLFVLLTGKNPFVDSNPSEIARKAKFGERPKLPSKMNQMKYWSWVNLIDMCWSQNPLERPSFSQICDVLETSEFVNNDIVVKDFDEYKKIINRKMEE